MITDEEIKLIAAQHDIYDSESIQILAFARRLYQLGRQHQRESDAAICRAGYVRMEETANAHYRLSNEAFKPESYGFNQFELRNQAELADRILNNTGD